MEEERIKNNPRIGVARMIARKLIADAGIEKPPVLLGPIINFLKKESNLTLKAWDFPKSIDGIHLLDENVVVIGYNQNVNYFRKRFTIAHELGHFLLKHLIKEHEINLYDKDPQEKEANAFAAELLMPTDFIKPDFKGKPNIELLSMKYLVSREAIGWKIYDNLNSILK
jgi:Zn-dependent peptidase ImmA (M78 family)